jgi:hypothetical protein
MDNPIGTDKIFEALPHFNVALMPSDRQAVQAATIRVSPNESMNFSTLLGQSVCQSPTEETRGASDKDPHALTFHPISVDLPMQCASNLRIRQNGKP